MLQQNRMSEFCVESLEPRLLLSSVQVFAAGEVGSESFAVLVDQEVVATFTEIGTDVAAFDIDLKEEVTADQIRVAFLNDYYDPDTGEDWNLTVDRLVLDRQIYETEASNVFSSGVWVEGQGITSGYLQTETLHTDGYFQFSAGSEIVVRAAGQLGIESFELQVNQETVATFQVSDQYQEFTYQSDFDLNADQIRIVFDESQYADDQDPNLYVDWLSIDGVTIQTESPYVYSTGTWTPEDGIQPGFGRGEMLHTTGYLQFAAGDVVEVQVGGQEGDEVFQVLIDDSVVLQQTVDQDLQWFTVYHDQTLEPYQIRVQMVNDLYDPDNGFDRNLFVPQIRINGQVYQTDSPSTYSTGSWTAEDGIVPGLGRGDVLHTDGYFQWQTFEVTSDEFYIPEDGQQVLLAVMANDVNQLGDDLSLSDYELPTSGQLELIDGQLYYSPTLDFVGDVQFRYRIASDQLQSQWATVTVHVMPSHQQPQHEIDSRVADELTPSGQVLEVAKYVQIPLGDDGSQPRLNGMAVTGNRQFVVADGNADGEGKIYELIMVNGVPSAALFLDVGTAVTAATGRLLDNHSPQGGLRSLVFHPDFAINGLFYTSVMEERPADPSSHTYISDSSTPVGADGVVIEWQYDHLAGQVDTNSYREVFRVGMHVYDHPIKGITFNPFSEPGDEDYGLLYVGHGDGSVQSAIAGDGQGNDALGKILRINPLATEDGSYSVPSSNPFVGNDLVLDEVYALGFRNPHNLTFAADSNSQVHLIVTEVGRDNIEEINLVVAGGNYGWGLREGPFLHTPEGNGSYGINGNIELLPENEADYGFIFPTTIWGHDGEVGDTFVAQAITGGHVISDPASPLYGQFIFAEFATDGRAYHVDFESMLQQVTQLDPTNLDRDQPSELTWLTPQELTIMFDHDNDPTTPSLVRQSIKDILDDEPDFAEVLSAGKTRADLRFGQGANGELFVLNKRNGWIYLVTNSVGNENLS